LLILDTDHVSALGHSSDASRALLQRIADSGEDAATTVITLEEQLRGWLAEINRIADAHRQIVAYNRLQQVVNFFAAWRVLPWDSDSAANFVSFRREGVRIGSMDLKIACIALDHDATLLTRNVTDFSKVPGLRIENWLD